MNAVVEAMQKDARRRLGYARAKLADAIKWQDPPAQRRAEKSIGTYTAKVLCPHTYISHKRLRVSGYDKFAYTCIECKTHILSRIQL